MNWGNLYYFDPKAKVSLEDTIKVCAIQYEQKFKNKPLICELSPNLAIIGVKVDGLSILEGKQIQNNHFWLGVE